MDMRTVGKWVCVAGGMLTVGMLLVSCDRGKGDATVETQPQDSTTATVSGEQIIISDGSVGPVKLGMSKEELLKILGKPDADENGTLKYFSRGMELFVTRKGVQKVFLHARTPVEQRRGFNNYDEFKGATDKGVRVGSQKQDVASAHGQAPEQQALGAEENWHYPEQGMAFTFDANGSVRTISIHQKTQ